jgi:hypothetical protein
VNRASKIQLDLRGFLFVMRLQRLILEERALFDCHHTPARVATSIRGGGEIVIG